MPQVSSQCASSLIQDRWQVLGQQVNVGAGAGSDKLQNQLLFCSRNSPPKPPLAPSAAKPAHISPEAAWLALTVLFLDVDGSLCVGWQEQGGQGTKVDFCREKSGSKEAQAGFTPAGWGDERQPNTALQSQQVARAEWIINYKQYMQVSALSRGAAHKWCTGCFKSIHLSKPFSR